MEQFFCEGECKGVSNKPCTCQAKTCSYYGKPLVKKKIGSQKEQSRH